METLEIEFNESDIEQILRVHDEEKGAVAWDCSRVGTVEIKCRFTSASGDLLEEFRVDGALVPMSIKKNLTDAEVQAARTQRTFYYLNGLLRALSTLRVRQQRRAFGPLKIVTDKNYLFSNAKIERISNWKKRGYVGADGKAIQLPTLWNYVYDWMTARFGFNKGLIVVSKADELLSNSEPKNS